MHRRVEKLLPPSDIRQRFTIRRRNVDGFEILLDGFHCEGYVTWSRHVISCPYKRAKLK